MKTYKLLTVILLALGAITYGALGEEKKENRILKLEPYQANQWTFSGFGSYRAHEFSELDGRFGGGAEVGYSITPNITIAAEGLAEDSDGSAIDEAGLNLKFYLPLGQSGFAPYGLLGASYSFAETTVTQFHSGESNDEKHSSSDGYYTSRTISDNEWRMNAGAGIEFRAAKTFSLFADGRWTHNFKDLGHALFRVGANLRF